MVARVPAGRVTTYGDVAAALGRPAAARAVGAAMHCNPHAPRVPCHRVVGSTGRLTGFAGGLPKKRTLLLAEGLQVENDRVKLDDAVRMRHDELNTSAPPLALIKENQPASYARLARCL